MGLMEQSLITFLLILVQLSVTYVQAKEFCTRENYLCESGHCCGSGQCCNYYYELWWFWVIWIIVLLIGGCCAWQRRRVRKLMRQQSRQAEEIQTVIQNSPPLTDDWFTDGMVPPWKLPSYTEIGNTVAFGTPPPPYTHLRCEAELASTSQRSPPSNTQQQGSNTVPQRLVNVIVHQNSGQNEVGVQASEIQIRNALLANTDRSSSQSLHDRSSTITPEISPCEVKLPLPDSPISNEASPLGATGSSVEEAQVAEEAVEQEMNNNNDSDSSESNRPEPIVPRFRDTVVELSGNNTKAARV
ncbi:uncharacterized protein LOC144446465 [Glandiceps talaboti]